MIAHITLGEWLTIIVVAGAVAMTLDTFYSGRRR